jgi:hypothetical protein
MVSFLDIVSTHVGIVNRSVGRKPYLLRTSNSATVSVEQTKVKIVK